MQYEWDVAKNKANQQKHGVAFELIEDAAWHGAFAMKDTRKDYGEDRFLAYVPIQGRLHAVIYVIREPKRRIISLWKANERERKFYEQSR